MDTEKDQPQRIAQMVQRLDGMFTKEFGVNFSYVSMSELSQTTKNRLLAESLVSPKKCPQISDDVYFPIRVDRRVVAAGKIKPPQNFSKDSIEKMNDVVQLTLCPLLASMERVKTLKLLEEQLQKIEGQQESSNLVSLDGYRKLRSETYNDSHRPTYQKTRFNLPCFIQCVNLSEGRKMALEIHSKSNRYAFLSVNDIDWTEDNPIGQLGEVSLFIPEIANLKAIQILGLLDYFKGLRTKFSPQLISCSLYSPKVLYKKGISKNLIDQLTVAHLNMTDKFNSYQTKTVSEFFFDSLTMNESNPTPTDS